VPLFAVVRAKRPNVLVTRPSALQSLSNFPIIDDSHSPTGYFFLDMVKHRSELSPVHEYLLPFSSNPRFQPSFVRNGNAGEAVVFRARLAGAWRVTAPQAAGRSNAMIETRFDQREALLTHRAG
jgi:hypothetical protein